MATSASLTVTGRWKVRTTVSSRRRINGRPTLAERLAAYPGKEHADAILAGFPLPEVGLGPDPSPPRVRDRVSWSMLQRESDRRGRGA